MQRFFPERYIYSDFAEKWSMKSQSLTWKGGVYQEGKKGVLGDQTRLAERLNAAHFYLPGSHSVTKS